LRTFLSLVLLLPSLALSASTFQVTSVADSGPGSLRQAILDANEGPCSPVAPCRIEFAIPAPVPASGWFTIAPQSPLPVLDRSPITLDATTQKALTGDTNPAGPEVELDGTHAGYRSGLKAFAAYGLAIQGFAVNRFEGHGIFVDAGASVNISGNYVGVDPTGSVALPNGFDGIALRNISNSLVSRNVIGGNRKNGVYVFGSTQVSISLNRIGVSATGDVAIPNEGNGIDASGSALYIQSNTVAFNRLHGVVNSGGVSVFGNEIFGNGLLGIANGMGGPAEGQMPEPPVLVSATENSDTNGFYTGFPRITGTVHGTPNSSISVAAYATPRLNASGLADGQQYLGRTTVTTDAEGNATFKIDRDYGASFLDLYGGFVTATAQPAGGPTSAFSAPIALTITTPTLEVTSTRDAGPGSLRAAIDGINGRTCTVESACRISFNVPAEALTDGVARVALESPLPPIRGYVRISGASQTWWHGDTNPDGPEVEVRGGSGLQFGTETTPSERAYIHQIAINGSSSNGLTIYCGSTSTSPSSQPRVIVREILSGIDAHGSATVPNGGSGVRIAKGIAGFSLFDTNVEMSNSIISGNAQHGVSIDGSLHRISSNRIGTDITGRIAIPNGGDGVHVYGGTRIALDDNVIAYNTGAGVATSAGVRAPSVYSSVHHNGGLGIDVNDDGVSPADGNNDDGTIDPPVITRAWYDAERKITFVEGTSHTTAPLPPPAFDGEGDRFANVFFLNSTPDSSGFEGEELVYPYYPPLTIVEGGPGTFRIGYRGDYRGKWFTATTNRYFCYYEAGCSSRESSEFSAAVKVE
jgi:hypothetical protein